MNNGELRGMRNGLVQKKPELLLLTQREIEQAKPRKGYKNKA